MTTDDPLPWAGQRSRKPTSAPADFFQLDTWVPRIEVEARSRATGNDIRVAAPECRAGRPVHSFPSRRNTCVTLGRLTPR